MKDKYCAIVIELSTWNIECNKDVKHTITNHGVENFVIGTTYTSKNKVLL